MKTTPGYEPLAEVLERALQQASGGKGKERHQQGSTPFLRQPITEIPRMLGGPQFDVGQAIKKGQEAMRMEPNAAVRELLGAINYMAAAVIIIEEAEENRRADSQAFNEASAHDEYISRVNGIPEL